MPPRAERPLRRLIALGAAVTLGLGTLIALVVYFVLTSGAVTNYDGQFDYPFSGGLVDLVKAGLGLAAAALLIGSVLVGRRSLHTAAHSPHRRLVILVGVVLGFLFSGIAAFAADRALSWASDHSSQAHAARASAKAMLANYRLAPRRFRRSIQWRQRIWVRACWS